MELEALYNVRTGAIEAVGWVGRAEDKEAVMVTLNAQSGYRGEGRWRSRHRSWLVS